MEDVIEVKANQLEIKVKLDLVLQFEKEVDFLLQILSKKKEKKEVQGGYFVSDEFLNPPLVDHTPPISTAGPIVVYQSSPSVREVPASKMENVLFKQRKLVNTKLKDFTNSSSEQFKVNDLCDVNPLRPYDKD